MIQTLGVSAFMGVFWAVFGLVLAILVLRWLDKQAGRSFNDVYMVITGESLGAAVYHGLRFVGVCLLLGLIIY